MTGWRAAADVVIVGAGPVGLLLAGELALGGADVLVLDRRETPMAESRAGQLTTRTAELLDERGLTGLLAGTGAEPRAHYAGLPVALGRVDSAWAGNRTLPQYRTEAALADRARALGASLCRGHELRGLEPGADRVGAVVASAGGSGTVDAGWVVGCDGEAGAVRDLGGFTARGAAATREMLRADVGGLDVRDRRFERHERGLAVAATRDGVTRVMVHEAGRPVPRRTGPPAFAEVVERWRTVTGEDISGGEPLWLDAFDNHHAHVERYRRGRVLLAGDAAHRHMPIGGQSLNVGLQDAANLGWKLAAVVRGDAGDDLLDTYHAERHPQGARTLESVLAQESLLLGGAEVEPLRAVLGELLGLDAVVDRLADRVSGVDIHYALGVDHPWAGRRMPASGRDADALRAALSGGRGVALTDDPAPVRPWATRVGVLPARGGTHALVRPDGYVAWAGEDPAGLVPSLRRWFGAA